MAFDAYFMTAVLEEIREKCIGARIDKIHQPSRDTLIILLKSRESREKLIFVANPTSPRLHLTTASPENPAEPPMFCMLLRKHLLGAKLNSITQPPMERAATFTFDCTDEMGYPVQKKLVAELMGRTCNLYLLSPEGRIIDCLRRIGLDESAKRAALPGLMYQEPEAITKENPSVFENYVNFFDGPGADLLFTPTFGGPFMSLMIVFVPQVVVFSLLCTYAYRRTKSVYVGGFTAAMMACWIVTGGSAMF